MGRERTSLRRALAGLATLPLWVAGSLGAAWAADGPRRWEMGLQPAATPVMERMEQFHSGLLIVITIIAGFVMLLLLYVMLRFNQRANPTPSRVSHNTVLEVVWTALPVLILVGIAIPSFRLLYYQDRTKDAEMTIKAIGHQWYWSYEYPDNGNFTFDAVLVPDTDIKPGQLRLLETDNSIILPVDTNIRLLTTASDVIHSWAVPAFGIKLDSVPGRVNETWLRITRAGTFYGQCSELCGTDHAYMPIKVEAVSKEKFQDWVAAAKTKFARADAPTSAVAAAEPAN